MIPRLKKHFHTLLYKKAYSRAFFGNFGILIKELRVLFTQFFTWRYPLVSILNVFKFGLYSIFRFLTGRSYRGSYSFTGEDRIIESLLNRRINYNGFYVDIGCNHPTFISNTFSLYRKGWRGVCLDPNKKLIDKFKKVRQRDKALAVLVSNEPGKLEYIEYTNNVLSSVDKSTVESYLKEGQEIVSRTTMKTRTLTEILDSLHAPIAFDLLSIDAEEHDFSILQSLDLKKYNPELIIVELEDFDPYKPVDSPVTTYLAQYDYQYKGFILKNAYYQKST